MNNRTQEMHILWTPEEYDLLTQRMHEAGVINRSAFVRKMELDGYILKLDMADIHEMIRLLRNATNNLNQMAKQANSTGSIYGAEISDMQQKQDEIWETSKEILGADSTIDSLCNDIVEHYEKYRANLLTGKAMIVAYSRPIAMKIYPDCKNE